MSMKSNYSFFSRAEKLDRIVFRIGILAALRSKATKGSMQHTQ